MIINNRYIFNRILKVLIELSVLITASFIVENNIDNDRVISIFIIASMSFYYLKIICSIFLFQVYLNNINKIFENQTSFEIWMSYFFFYRLKCRAYNVFTAINFTVTIAFMINSTKETKYNSGFLSILYGITALSLLNIFKLFFFLCLHCYYSIQDERIDIELDEIHVQRNIERLDEECSICLEKDEKEWASLKCNHKFHYECIIPWVNAHRTCPICRVTL